MRSCINLNHLKTSVFWRKLSYNHKVVGLRKGSNNGLSICKAWGFMCAPLHPKSLPAVLLPSNLTTPTPNLALEMVSNLFKFPKFANGRHFHWRFIWGFTASHYQRGIEVGLCVLTLNSRQTIKNWHYKCALKFSNSSLWGRSTDCAMAFSTLVP